jgi:hypothetical protein
MLDVSVPDVFRRFVFGMLVLLAGSSALPWICTPNVCGVASSRTTHLTRVRFAVVGTGIAEGA